MAWGRIDDDAWCHARFAEVRPNAYALYWAMNSYSNSQLLDGHFTDAQVKGVATLRLLPYKAMRDAIDNLVAAGVWEVEPSGYHVHDYLDYNDSKADILARREERSEAGRLGGKRSGEVRRARSNEAKTKQTRSTSLDVACEANEANANPVPGPGPGTTKLLTNVSNFSQKGSKPTAKRAESGRPVGPQAAMFSALQEEYGEGREDIPLNDAERRIFGKVAADLVKSELQPSDVHVLRENIRNAYPNLGTIPPTMLSKYVYLLRSPPKAAPGLRAVDQIAATDRPSATELYYAKQAREGRINGVHADTAR